MWLTQAYLVLTLGELLISPLGLSMITGLAPAGKEGRYVSYWYISTALGNVMAGELGVLWSRYYDKLQPQKFFYVVAALCFLASCSLFLLKDWMQKIMPKKIKNIGDGILPPSLVRSFGKFSVEANLPPEYQMMLAQLVAAETDDKRREVLAIFLLKDTNLNRPGQD
jgi:MFS family permease